jgi:hypothetical protein
MRLWILIPFSLTFTTLHGAEKDPRCNCPALPTSTRDDFRLKPIDLPPAKETIAVGRLLAKHIHDVWAVG